MGKGIYLHFMLILSILFSCDTPELKPRTNPRFSMAFIQEIDSLGAQFAANVYDFGSDEIIEYGFLYSRDEKPRFGNSEVIKGEGKPEKYFEMKAVHSMVAGQAYNVVAFLKTRSDLVFSEPLNFHSLGSTGFIFEKFEYADPIYFGDTITVRGSNFSNYVNNYSVLFQRQSARIVEVGETYFKFLVPEYFEFDPYQNVPGSFNISLEILQKKMAFEIVIPFAEAVLDEMPIQRIDFDGTVEIRGRYLLDKNISVYNHSNVEEGYTSVSQVLEVTENKIVFKPYVISEGVHNFVEVVIRGKMYKLGNAIFEFNPTEIDPGQELTLSYDDSFTIKGSNFNVEKPYIHKGLINGNEVYIDASASDKETLTLRFARYRTTFQRNAAFGISTFGKSSENRASLEFTDPVLPFMRNPIPSINLSDYLITGNTVSYEGMGYTMGNRNIFQIDPEKKTMEFIRTLPMGIQHLEFAFSITDGENWYIGGGRDRYTLQKSKAFFRFNMLTHELKKLPDLSLEQASPFLVHIYNNQLYIEGSTLSESTGGGYDSGLRYKFDLKTEKWSPLPDKLELRYIVGKTVAFAYGEKHLSLGTPDGSGDDGLGLYEFDGQSERWKLKKLLGLGGVKADEVYVIGQKAFFLSNTLNVLDMETLQVSTVSNIPADLLNCDYYRSQAFTANGKIYVYDCEDMIYELDPEYFEYF